MTELHRLKTAIEFLKEREKEKGKTLTNEAICTKLKYKSSNYLSDILSGGTKKINGAFLDKLEVHYRISRNWIETGNGLMEESVVSEPNPNAVNNTKSNYKIEINTSGKKFIVAADNKNEIKLLNAFLAEKEERQKEAEQRAEKAEQRAERAEQEKDRLYSVIEQNLTALLQVTKGINEKLGETKTDPDAQP